MADSSWDNGGGPTPGKRFSPTVTILIGSGLGLATLLVVALAWGLSALWKSNQARSQALEQVWTEIRTDLRQIGTEEGARTFYRENPGLAVRYPTEASFQRACATWKPRLEEFPKHPPLATGAQGLEFSYHPGGQAKVYLSYALPQGGVFRFASQHGRVVGLSVE